MDLSPLRQLLFTAKTKVPLLHWEGYLAVLVTAVVHRYDSWVPKYDRLLIDFLPGQLAEVLLVL